VARAKSPGPTSTYTEAELDGIEALKSVGTPIGEAIQPILALIDNPPAETVSAHLARTPLANIALADGLIVTGTRISLAHRAFDENDATRLYQLTQQLLTRHGPATSADPSR
jgi:hypothetical protein